jgi:hypothetical protein
MTDSLIIVKMIVRLIIHMGLREEEETEDSEGTLPLTHRLPLLPMKQI